MSGFYAGPYIDFGVWVKGYWGLTLQEVKEDFPYLF